MSDLKYSIILPVYNGLPYLQTAVASVLASNRNDFELLVSDDHSTDGSIQYLESILDSRLRLLRTPARMSMAEHWEWALSQSKGPWVMFLGQDDALQGYFFDHADTLTTEAAERSLRVIAARRSYIFWPGCESDFSQRAQYFAVNRTYERSTVVDAISSLLFGKKYHELPQMYTNSLFHVSLIEETRRLQGGKVFTCHPQDANLAALALLLEKSYLRSEVPLGWVGTSPSSAGLAIAKSGTGDTPSEETLAGQYQSSISASKLEYPSFAGEFSLASEAIYLWQALIVVSKSIKSKRLRFLSSRIFLVLLFSSILAENYKIWRGTPRLAAFFTLVNTNMVGRVEIMAVTPLLLTFHLLREWARRLGGLLIRRSERSALGIFGFQVFAQDAPDLEFDTVNLRSSLCYEESVGR